MVLGHVITVKPRVISLGDEAKALVELGGAGEVIAVYVVEPAYFHDGFFMNIQREPRHTRDLNRLPGNTPGSRNGA